MKKIILTIVTLILLTGCGKQEPKENNELFLYGATTPDERVISMTFDIPYEDNILNSLVSGDLTIEKMISKMELIETYKDGGSKLYQYKKEKKTYGNKNFYLMSCNTTDGNKNVYIAKEKDTLKDICEKKVNDLKGVSMSIKEGTLTPTGATIVITDTSKRNNIYGDPFIIYKEEETGWVLLDPIIENYGFNDIGYQVDKNNTLELTTNWEWLYGTLESGNYKLIKGFSYIGEGINHYLSVEFTI